MRRKSERTKTSSNTTSSSARRTTRRGRKSKSHSPAVEPTDGSDRGEQQEEKVSDRDNEASVRETKKNRNSSGSDADDNHHSLKGRRKLSRSSKSGGQTEERVGGRSSRRKRTANNKAEEISTIPALDENGTEVINEKEEDKKEIEIEHDPDSGNLKQPSPTVEKPEEVESASIPEVVKETDNQETEKNLENDRNNTPNLDSVLEIETTGFGTDNIENSAPAEEQQDRHDSNSVECQNSIEPMEFDASPVDMRYVRNNSSSERSVSPPSTHTKERSKLLAQDQTGAQEQLEEGEIPCKEGEDVEKEKADKENKLCVQRPVRKRRWMSRKTSDAKPHVLAISTDSLKNLISDVRPVPLSDVRLESSPEVEVEVVVPTNGDHGVVEEIPLTVAKEHSRRDRERQKERESKRDRSRERESRRSERDSKPSLAVNRKISIIEDEKSMQRPPSPPRNTSSEILYITNLVRPFTVLQLKGLLARTGKIVENGFWMDKIKSKCYVKFETEDQAVETRHALHGVRWPQSNPKCLHVDFGSESAMGKAMESTLEDGLKLGVESSRDNRVIAVGRERDRLDFGDKKDIQVSRPVREWDVGKKEDADRDPGNDRGDRDRERNRKQHSMERDRDLPRERDRRSLSESPSRKFKKKENEPPLRLLDDLFRKTKTAPCIYWLPLTPEQIAEKEEVRRKNIEAQEKRLEELRKEREREREREKEREKERERDRDKKRERSSERRSSRSRDRRRY